MEEYGKDYEEYVQPLIAYYSGDNSLLISALQVREIIKKGEYIMDIFGGEEKKGKETYAGLAITDVKFNKMKMEYDIKLYRMNNYIRIPLTLFKQYGVQMYNV